MHHCRVESSWTVSGAHGTSDGFGILCAKKSKLRLWSTCLASQKGREFMEGQQRRCCHMGFLRAGVHSNGKRDYTGSDSRQWQQKFGFRGHAGSNIAVRLQLTALLPASPVSSLALRHGNRCSVALGQHLCTSGGQPAMPVHWSRSAPTVRPTWMMTWAIFPCCRAAQAH